MQKNHLFTTLFVSVAIALISFVSPSARTAASTSVSKMTAAPDSVTDAKSEAAALSTTLYQTLNLAELGLSHEAMDYAVKGYQKLVADGVVDNARYLTVIDFSQSSRKKRFYLIDVQEQKLVLNTFVSHGKNTGVDMAKDFSNTINSEKSSLGFYVTGNTYTGKHGLSLRLDGQDTGFNHNAMARGIVVHGAAYVNAGRVNSDFMGRSQGCPALPEAEYEQVINHIKDGSVMFLYYPAQEYIQQSPVLNS